MRISTGLLLLLSQSLFYFGWILLLIIFISCLKMLQINKEQSTPFHRLCVTHDFINQCCTLTGLFSIMKSCSLIHLSRYNNRFYTFEDGCCLSQFVLLNWFKLHYSSYSIKSLMSLVFSSKISPSLSKCASKPWHCPAE